MTLAGRTLMPRTGSSAAGPALVDLGNEREAERVIETLTRRREGRIDLQLLGPVAAYDFTGTAQPDG
jgi:hypothetical protein